MRRRLPRGLTLIEMVVVIAIMTLLMSAVGVYAIGQLTPARTSTAKLDVKNALSALEMYRGTFGKYPAPSEGFAPLVKARTLKSLPKDPWGHVLTWSLRDGEPVVVSRGADGEAGGEGEAADISSADPE